MNQPVFFRIILFLAFFPLTLSHAEIQEAPFVSVMAASSLTIPLTELARSYSATHGVTVNVTYDSSVELANQIEQGEHTDVFISANAFSISLLKRKELIDIRTITDIAHNKLALIASVDNPLAQKKPDRVTTPWQWLSTSANRSTLVIGDPETTALGAYTREMVQNLGLWEKILPLSIKAENARIALYLIAQGKGVGITFYSDAISSKDVKILSLFPQKLYTPVTYRAVALEGKGKIFAIPFIEFLSSPKAKEALRQAGFEVAE